MPLQRIDVGMNLIEQAPRHLGPVRRAPELFRQHADALQQRHRVERAAPDVYRVALRGSRGLRLRDDSRVQEVLAESVAGHRVPFQDVSGERALVAEEAQQKVPRADSSLTQTIGFLRGVLQNAFARSTEGNLGMHGHLLSYAPVRPNLGSRLGVRKVRDGEQIRRRPFVRAKQPEEKMFGLNFSATKLRRLVPGEEQRAPRWFGKAFEHNVPDLPDRYRASAFQCYSCRARGCAARRNIQAGLEVRVGFLGGDSGAWAAVSFQPAIHDTMSGSTALLRNPR
jgi:hypothetical protein